LLFPAAKYFHFLLLVAIGAMLLSGPLLVWSAGEAIKIFAFAIPSPFGKLPAAQNVLRTVHGLTASFILAGIIFHVLAVFKHVIVNRDGTFDKIMIADGVRHE
jgi:cytochrome b561